VQRLAIGMLNEGDFFRTSVSELRQDPDRTDCHESVAGAAQHRRLEGDCEYEGRLVCL